MAITGVNVYGDEYNESIENAISILSDLNSSNALSAEMAGGSSTEIIVMPINITITVPLSFAINIFCEDPSCVDLAYSYIFDENGSAFDFTSQYTYIFDNDGNGFEAYSDDIDFEEFLTLLFENISDSGEIDMSAYSDFFDASHVPDQASTTKPDIGTLNDQYVELFNKYYGKNAGKN